MNRWRRLRDDRGAASVELAVAAPLLLFLLLAIIQFAVWSHASHIAQASASHGLAAARVHGATADDGDAAAVTLLNELGDGPLTEPRVTVRRTDDAVTVRVTGHAATVLPGVRLPVRADAAGPVEIWTDG